jgi:hypothetical protein
MATVLIAGCTGQSINPLDWNKGTGATNVEAADLVVATNEPTIPSSPSSGTDFTARFTVKNQHTTEKSNDTGVWIYDTGRCVITKIGGLTPDKVGQMWPGLTLETADGVKHVATFAAGQQELVRLDMRAPTSSEMGGLPYTCPIRYMINYTFKAKSSVTADVMSSDRLKQIETQTGERPTYARTLNVGTGPIRTVIEPKSALPVESGKLFKLEITVKNDGTGDYASVMPRTLLLKAPEGFEPVLENDLACGGFFQREGTENGVTTYHNYRKIDLIQKSASPITCEFTAPAVDVEKEYAFTTELPYSYGYFGQQIDVPITP